MIAYPQGLAPIRGLGGKVDEGFKDKHEALYIPICVYIFSMFVGLLFFHCNVKGEQQKRTGKSRARV